MKVKAIVCTRYGPPEGPQLKEVERHTPRGDEVLIQVQAVSVNRSDWERTDRNAVVCSHGVASGTIG